MPPVCRVILIGMMGSGKSTIGRLLSDATGWPYVDNDDLVRRATGSNPRELLAAEGEAAMRAAESRALADGVRTAPPAIVGAAAGTILDPANRELLRDGGVVVWLRADPGVLAERASGAEHRPWLEGDAAGWMREATAARDPLYASVADVVVDTGKASAESSAQEIRDGLATRPECDEAS
jgi:shikimate kinase